MGSHGQGAGGQWLSSGHIIADTGRPQLCKLLSRQRAHLPLASLDHQSCHLHCSRYGLACRFCTAFASCCFILLTRFEALDDGASVDGVVGQLCQMDYKVAHGGLGIRWEERDGDRRPQGRSSSWKHGRRRRDRGAQPLRRRRDLSGV